MQQKRLFIIIGFILVLLLGGIFAVGIDLASKPGNRPKVGDIAPDFSLNLYEGYQAGYGNEIKLNNLRGKVVLINFWASWCAPCRDEAKDLEDLWRKYRSAGLVIIGVDELDTESAARQYLQSFDITYPNGLDIQQKIGKNLYRITGQPETFIIDKKGVIRNVFIQPLSFNDVSHIVEPLLQESN
jgi:cytochrome c biogenesis protein CcmG/thiol:disulfide interchange protein DsbE